MELNEILIQLAKENGAKFVRFVDLSDLPKEQNRGYQNAILIGTTLSAGYIHRLENNKETEYEEFSTKEHQMDLLAEKIADYLNQEGFLSFAQSEANLYNHGEYNASSKRTPLPHKTIAVMAGLGWIGKDNLLVTKEYGSAICMCTVLTNAPINSVKDQEIIVSQCGECQTCSRICPKQVIHGQEWKIGVDRDELVNVFECMECLKCLANCIWTKAYANRLIK